MIARLIVYACALVLIATGLTMLLSGPLWYALTPGVRMTGPYNAHFVLDIGFAFLASGAVLAVGAWMGARGLMMAGLSWPALHAACMPSGWSPWALPAWGRLGLNSSVSSPL